MKNDNKYPHETRNRIYLICVFLSVVTLFMLMTTNYKRTYAAAKSNVIELSKSSSARNAEHIEMFFLRHEDVLLTTAEALELELEKEPRDKKKIEHLLREITFAYDEKIYRKFSNKQFTGIYASVDGEMINGFRTPEDLPEGYDPTKRPWYLQGYAGNGDIVFGEPYLDIYEPYSVMSATKLLSDKKTVIGMDITLDDLQYAAGNMDLTVNLNDKLHSYGYGFVTTEKGIVVAHKDKFQQGQDYGSAGNHMHEVFEQAKVYAASKQDYFEANINGTNYAIFPHQLSNGWYLVTLTEATEMNAALSDFFLITVLVIVIVILLSFGYTLFISIAHIKSERLRRELTNVLALAKKDGLTGHSNRTAYDIRIKELTSKMHTEDDISFAIIMLDLNDLKYVNDNYGHAAGDQYIRNSCNIVNQTIASEIYRIAGDEFVLFLTDDLFDHCEELFEQLKEAVSEGNNSLIPNVDMPSIAVGMASHNKGTPEDMEMILHKADTQMYTNKALIKQARLKNRMK